MLGSLGAAPDELIVTTDESHAKGYQLLKAMGFKDRGHSRFCFKHYDSDDSEDSDEDYGIEDIPSRTAMKPPKAKKYYTGPFIFKADLHGIGYRP